MDKAYYRPVFYIDRILAWDIFASGMRIASVRTRREARNVVRLINA